MNPKYVTFMRWAAFASVLSAVTTLLLALLPELFSATSGFEGRMARVLDPAYRLRSWAYLVHPFLVMAAILGLTAATLRRAPFRVVLGAAAFCVWGITEAGQQILTLFVFDVWRSEWLAGDPDVVATMRLRTAIYDGIWNALYVLLLVAFLAGNLLFASVLFGWNRISTVLALFFVAGATLSLVNLVAEIFSLSPSSTWFDRMYVAIQPLGRAFLGGWLLVIAGRTSKPPANAE